jgi:glycosyltransferase involved in cell wall biosynthesis
MSPKVSVLMSVRNGEQFVDQAIKSVLSQSMKEFELLVADDMSSDGTAAILCKAAKADKRIKLVVNYENMGLTKSLNKLIRMASGEFIARIDADDRARGDRLDRQCLMMKDDSLVMATSCYRTIGDQTYSHCPSLDPDALGWSLVFRNNIRHSTVMWRSELEFEYDENYRYSQDYEMWCRMARIGKIGVINEPLAEIRIHESTITSARREEQDDAADSIAAEQFKHYTGRTLSNHESHNLRLIHYLKDAVQFEQFHKLSELEVRHSLNLYIELLEKFHEREKIAEDVEKDMRSLMDSERGKFLTVEACGVIHRFGKKHP